MEPVTAVAVGKLLWDYFGKPILDSAKEQYGDKILEKLDGALSKFKFKRKELEVIEAELVEADKEVFQDEKSLITFLENNEKINEVLKQLNKRGSNINIKVKKGVGYIEKAGDINIS